MGILYMENRDERKDNGYGDKGQGQSVALMEFQCEVPWSVTLSSNDATGIGVGRSRVGTRDDWR